MKHAILLDFGSTYTKVVCVDLRDRKVIAADKFPSTVCVDAGIALGQCLKSAKQAIGEINFDDALKLSASSAAGGLRIAVSGLTESLSIKAGRNASFGAGGKIVFSGSGMLDGEDLKGMRESGAEIILLCGGYEGGNSGHLLHNAELLSASDINVPVIYAGNSKIAKEVRAMFMSRGKECFAAENMMPDVGVLNVSSTVEIIRNLFMERITNMKGVGMVKSFVDAPVVPTPAAVLSAGELLFRGTDTKAGIGSYMMMDIGGATTDVYSFAENKSYEGAKQIGSPEPAAKRTVEGDMGMRESSVSILKEVGGEVFSGRCGLPQDAVEESVMRRVRQREYIADNPDEKKVDIELAASAVEISARRHCGVVSREFCGGCRAVQRGKNLTEVKTVIGTGGILVNNPGEAESILLRAQAEPKERGSVLLPEKAEAVLDRDYVFFAAGLLRRYDDEAALNIMKNSIGV